MSTRKSKASLRKTSKSLSGSQHARRGSGMKAMSQLPKEHTLVRHSSGQLQQSPINRSKAEMRLFEKAQPTCIGSAAYLYLSSKIPLPPELTESAAPATMTLLEEMGARDALERLALSQVLLAHGRAAWLTKSLATQTDPDSFRVISEACERAAGTFVRLMRAFTEYRRPANTATNVSIAQANLAKQQIVQAFVKEEVSRGNYDEQSGIARRQPVITPALPANRQRAPLAAASDSTNPTVEKKQRTQNTGRKTSGRDECPKARRTISRRSRVKETDSGND